MKNFLPFRFEQEKTLLNSLNPVVRLVLPFFLVIPFLIIDNIYLIYTTLLFSFIFLVIGRLNLLRILDRVKTVIPFILLITVFLPFYIGEKIIYQFSLGFTLNIYAEGLFMAYFLFMRIFSAAFIFMSFFSSLTYSEFIEALTKLRLPAFFISSFIIMLHYIPIIGKSNKKILQAQELRGKKNSSYWEKLKSHAYIMGKSIVANLETSEKFYESLKMRGFNGNLTFSDKGISFPDVGMLCLFIALPLLFIFMVDLEAIFGGLIQLFLL